MRNQVGHTLNVAALPVGGVVEQQLGPSRLFVLKTENEKLLVFAVHYKDGRYYLPEMKWWRQVVPCKYLEFPTQRPAGLDPKGIIRCTDSSLPDYWKRNLQWDTTGKGLGEHTPDIQEIPYERRGDFIVIGTSF